VAIATAIRADACATVLSNESTFHGSKNQHELTASQALQAPADVTTAELCPAWAKR